MCVMIHDFLNLSRLEEGKMSLNCSVFQLDQLVKEVAEEAQMLSPQHHIVLEMSCELDIDADRDKIYQVLTNLLTNAMKYSDKSTVIRVSCYAMDEQVTIEVQDQGIGIALEDQPKLFNRFYRVRKEKNKRVGDFSIGLYLVSELLRTHGSKIRKEQVRRRLRFFLQPAGMFFPNGQILILGIRHITNIQLCLPMSD